MKSGIFRGYAFQVVYERTAESALCLLHDTDYIWLYDPDGFVQGRCRIPHWQETFDAKPSELLALLRGADGQTKIVSLETLRWVLRNDIFPVPSFSATWETLSDSGSVGTYLRTVTVRRVNDDDGALLEHLDAVCGNCVVPYSGDRMEIPTGSLACATVAELKACDAMLRDALEAYARHKKWPAAEATRWFREGITPTLRKCALPAQGERLDLALLTLVKTGRFGSPPADGSTTTTLFAELDLDDKKRFVKALALLAPRAYLTDVVKVLAEDVLVRRDDIELVCELCGATKFPTLTADVCESWRRRDLDKVRQLLARVCTADWSRPWLDALA